MHDDADSPFLFTHTQHSSPRAPPHPPGRVVAVGAAITQLSGEGLSHYNAITHSFHPHSQPAANQAPLPLLSFSSPRLLSFHPCLALLFLPPLHTKIPPHISAMPALTHHLHLPPTPDMAQNHPAQHLLLLLLWPLFRTFFHTNDRFREIHKSLSCSAGVKAGRYRSKGVKIGGEVNGKQHEIV